MCNNKGNIRKTSDIALDTHTVTFLSKKAISKASSYQCRERINARKILIQNILSCTRKVVDIVNLAQFLGNDI